MKPSTVTMRRGLFAVVAAAAVPAGSALFAAPAATGAPDPCQASEVARTVGSVAKKTGDYLDEHPDANQVMTSALQQQAGPQSLGPVKSYFEANPKVAGDLQGIAQPLTVLSVQCKLPITLPQALSLAQAAQGAGGLPNLPQGAPGTSPLGGTAAGGTAAGGTPATAPAAGQPTGPLPGPARTNPR
ncbi:hemophore [Mycobacterium intermedium]|uniref:Hemophore n=1 Tax=Mycobacterium intermedium TaxID=28445 RepID=A0A1E3S9K7_MYCIE|nr:hemophore [Mycobacterium intermedium]MCV6962786.1 hemophore [Mycobacterium intermedium]ODQ98257.1 hemophore [Mycobacterium intermedium]ORB09888.1 hemophore [Mycobacterium intermedium]